MTGEYFSPIFCCPSKNRPGHCTGEDSGDAFLRALVFFCCFFDSPLRRLFLFSLSSNKAFSFHLPRTPQRRKQSGARVKGSSTQDKTARKVTAFFAVLRISFGSSRFLRGSLDSSMKDSPNTPWREQEKRRGEALVLVLPWGRDGVYRQQSNRERGR